jgi:SAM-dependent methyltransferase
VTAQVEVVLCMDTEGPCDEPGHPELLATWEQVDAAMDKLFEPAFRARFPDPGGGMLRIGWFFLTWTGFTSNPRGRDFGYHRIRDHYLDRYGPGLSAYGDEECWHYHHPPPNGIGNEWGLDWEASDEHDEIVSRQLLERGWFPVCFRAGGTIVGPASSRWIDSWFPFDYTNRAPITVPELVDWSTGVAEWGLYHPDPEDFRRAGTGRRRMARCLDLATSLHALSEEDVEQAFARAESGLPAVLAAFDHDYRDIAGRIDAFRDRVQTVAARHGDVRWRYAGPVQAARSALGVPPPMRLELDAAVSPDGVHIWSNEPVFQSLPWLALRTPEGDVVHVEEGVVRLDETRWLWEPQRSWDELAVGASTDLGAPAVTMLTPDDGPGAVFLAAEPRRHSARPRSIWEHSKRYTRSVAERSGGREDELDSAAQTRGLLSERLSPEATVLDVGCGGGHLWRSLAPLGLSYFGIDGFRRAIEIGRIELADTGLPPERLRPISLEQLPPDERYDAVVSLSTLLYEPDFRRPLEVMAHAAERLLVVRSSFGATTDVRYLPDVLLDRGFESMRAYFSIFSRSDVEVFLAAEGFRVEWIEDVRQRERFGGEPEVVGGIPLPYEFLLAERR